jgi:tetratricopeptide (TPR) repeat protein
VHVNRGDEVEARWAFDRAKGLLGRREALERFWTELLAMPPDPKNPQESLERSTRGRAEMMAEDWGSAWREFLVAIRYSREYQWAVAGVAETSWRMGDVELAEKLLRQAIPKFPDRLEGLRADAKGKLAALLVERGRAPDEARDLARAALQVRGERAHLLSVLGKACDAVGDGACARDAYARLLALPHLPDDARRIAQERAAAVVPARSQK